MTIEQLKRAYPHWHFWQGVAGIFYASKRATSPPVVKRSPTAEGLRDQIGAEMRYREQRWG